MKIIISGGGSGGHVYPAIALIKQLQKHDPNLSVLYIGQKDSFEERACNAEGIPFKPIKVAYLHRKKIYKNFSTVITFIKACQNVKRIIRSFAPDWIIGTGGYVSAPVVYMGTRAKVKTIIHEQNTIPGLTNKLLSRYVRYVAISFPESKQYFPQKKVILTGNPRASLVDPTKKIDKQILGLSPDKKLLIIFFGSQGGKYINEKIAACLPILDEIHDVEIIFVTGKQHFEAISANLKGQSFQQVRIYPYLDCMLDYLAVADLVVVRAGATTIAEVTALGLPAIYIPSPYVTRNHQVKNATALVEQGAGIMMEEKTFSQQKFIETVTTLLKDDQRRKKIGEKARQFSSSDHFSAFINLLYHDLPKN